MTSTPRIIATLLAATAVALTAACAGSTAGRPGGASHRPDPSALPPGQVVYQIGSDGGGFTPADYRAATRPELTIYANGDAYLSEPPRSVSTPGQPWTFRTGRIAAPALTRLLADADTSGLFDEADFGMPQITDVGGTWARIRPTRAAARDVDVYALFFSEQDDDLSPAQAANRTALRHLAARFAHAVDVRHGTAWTPDRVAVIQRQVTGSTDPVGSGDPTSAEPWPGPTPARLLTRKSFDGPCGVVRGAAAAALFRAALAHASTHWTVGGSDVYLLVRGLLPGTPGCPN